MTLAEIYRNEGRIESIRAFAVKLLHDNQPKEKIIEWTGLTKEEPEELE